MGRSGKMDDIVEEGIAEPKDEDEVLDGEIKECATQI